MSLISRRPSVPTGSRCRNLRWSKPYDPGKNGLEPDRIQRSPADAVRAQLASAALVPVLHDRVHAHGRRLALVWDRSRIAVVWRFFAIHGLWLGGTGLV